MSAKILVVEDDPSILRGLEINLQLEGFEVACAKDGRAALEMADESVDLIVLDLMLPHLHGYQVCQRLRRADSDVPIVLLSAKDAEDDIVRGLEFGADDYVTKPYRFAELLARIKAHLRRRAPATRFSFSDVVVDFERELVHKAGVAVELNSREYNVLAFLIRNEGRAVTRDAILHAVWGSQYLGTDRTVDNYITKLRQKLDRPGQPAHILTVRGIGYRFLTDHTSNPSGP